ncbi:hypothetical protein GCM10025867_37250 [Frondihabitans sucicola]|uniref:HAD family hydrolase n=1 Tax=Frondihabitans sucicola TaxID=1268041 RepID=A0ABN6Y2F1_9MICO|nr:hypothetical protein GCM10025867_37250 [Frondihabitans sucicola]
MRATRVGSETQLSHIARLVEEAQTGKAQVQRLADRISGIFVPVVILLSVATFVGWLATGHSLTLAITAAVATVIIACPCALGLATPTALLVGTGAGATRGILIRGPQVLEQAGKVDTVVLDKTGTLTTGEMRVTDVVVAPGESREAVLASVAALESLSEHPVGRAIARTVAPAAEAALRVGAFETHGGSGCTASSTEASSWRGVARGSPTPGASPSTAAWRRRSTRRRAQDPRPSSSSSTAGPALSSRSATPCVRPAGTVSPASWPAASRRCC